jgi:riboflavin kinase/FMN adenylyltransferase
MRVVDELAAVQPKREMVLTIGVFDGVHPGHQYLINTLREKALEAGLLSGVITFSWHPRALLNPQTELPYLTSLEERIRLIKDLGIDHVIVLSFTTELSNLTAREFVTLLQQYLKMRGLVVGPDFALGKDREGNAEKLRALGQKLNFTVEVVRSVKVEEKVISSTAIRRALAKGDVENVTKLLGRRFRLSGKVVHGDHRGGELLGFPTTNLSVISNQALPADGTYVTLAYVSKKVHKALTNIGIRPTFGKSARTIETHILDFTGDLYKHDFSIEFIKRLRGEIKFDSLDKLKTQIESDVISARAMAIE